MKEYKYSDITGKIIKASYEVQLVNYLKATGIKVGLLINFGKSVEVKRRVFEKIK